MSAAEHEAITCCTKAAARLPATTSRQSPRIYPTSRGSVRRTGRSNGHFRRQRDLPPTALEKRHRDGRAGSQGRVAERRTLTDRAGTIDTVGRRTPRAAAGLEKKLAGTKAALQGGLTPPKPLRMDVPCIVTPLAGESVEVARRVIALHCGKELGEDSTSGVPRRAQVDFVGEVIEFSHRCGNHRSLHRIPGDGRHSRCVCRNSAAG